MHLTITNNSLNNIMFEHALSIVQPTIRQSTTMQSAWRYLNDAGQIFTTSEENLHNVREH